jgi:CRISPR/Cas system-associated exonuclease Cas4 (RecB family)
VQAEVVRALMSGDRARSGPPPRDEAHRVLEGTLERVAAEYRDALAPPIDRVWRDEILAVGADLAGWLDRALEEQRDWTPLHVEFGFGLERDPDRDPASRRDPVVLPDLWRLQGVVDLVEAGANGALRVTDYKTGKTVAARTLKIGGGSALQPTLYGLAMEAALGRPVVSGRLWYCTTAAGYLAIDVPLDLVARRRSAEALEIIDRAVVDGFLPPAPRDRACETCDFRRVCGPGEQRGHLRKYQDALASLRALRESP